MRETDKKLEKILPKVQKPASYNGGEFGSVYKDKYSIDVRVAFCFPDLYDIGMSNLGMKILYHTLNSADNVWCERCFMPNIDMIDQMKSGGIPLYALESKDALKDFDFIAFSLSYELAYTNVLAMLELAGLPLKADDRRKKRENGEKIPIVIAGGMCMCNPGPMEDFVDVFSIGEGEENLPKLMNLYSESSKRYGRMTPETANTFFDAAAEEPGTYIPCRKQNLPVRMSKIEDFENSPFPDKFVVPFTEIVHDRAMIEIMRGCVRGCRFCQAGFLYRPFRQRSPEKLTSQAEILCKNTGYDEISLTSLSSGDYERINELCDDLLKFCIPKSINLALPSLRIDNFSDELLKKVQSVRKSSLTFAPEAGTQRLRDVINKNVTEQDIINTCSIAFKGGTTSVKLYFMIGLPTETDDDIIGIADTAQKIVDLYTEITGRPGGKGLNITISLASFVPKPFTPFQWEPQITLEEIRRKQQLLLSSIKSKRITLNYHEGKTSVLEGAFARGDRRIGKVILRAYELGQRLDAWNEHFRFDVWQQAFADCGLSMEEYACRRIGFDDKLPWDVTDMGVTKKFLESECKKAYEGQTTPPCNQKCSGCGVTSICSGDLCPKKEAVK